MCSQWATPEPRRADSAERWLPAIRCWRPLRRPTWSVWCSTTRSPLPCCSCARAIAGAGRAAARAAGRYAHELPRVDIEELGLLVAGFDRLARGDGALGLRLLVERRGLPAVMEQIDRPQRVERPGYSSASNAAMPLHAGRVGDLEAVEEHRGVRILDESELVVTAST